MLNAISFSDTVVYIYTVKYHYMYSKPAYNKFTITMKSASFLQVINIIINSMVITFSYG